MAELDFLDGDTPSEPIVASTPEQTPEPAPQPEAQADGQPRGPDGKFAPKAAEPVAAAPAEPAPPVAPVAPVEPVIPPGYVPVSALQELRNEIRGLKAPKPQPQAPRPPPSVFEDEGAFASYMQEQTQTAVLNTKLDLSEDMARTQHGDEAVDAALVWFEQRVQQSPAFAQEVMGSRNPYGKLLADYQQSQLVSQVNPSEFQQFQAWKAAQAAVQQQQPAAPAAPPLAPTPPRSMASQPNAGGTKPGEQPVGPGVAFDAIFSR